MKKIIWTTADGRKIDVDDMSENHLRNTLKMLIREDLICFGGSDLWDGYDNFKEHPPVLTVG